MHYILTIHAFIIMLQMTKLAQLVTTHVFMNISQLTVDEAGYDFTDDYITITERSVDFI